MKKKDLVEMLAKKLVKNNQHISLSIDESRMLAKNAIEMLKDLPSLYELLEIDNESD